MELKREVRNFAGREVEIVSMDGKLEDIKDFTKIEPMLTNTAAKSATELSDELIKVGPNSPGSLDGTGLFQTLTAFKLREVYERSTAAA